MEDLTRLGKRTIFFSKATFLAQLSMIVMFGFMTGMFGNILNMNIDPESMGMGFLALGLLFGLSAMLVLLFVLIATIHFLVWVYRVTKNLRTKAKTVLSPGLSVISLIIWYVNIFAQFGIMRNLTHVQEKLLRDAGVAVKPVPMKFITLMCVCCVLTMVFTFNSSSVVLFTLSMVFAMAGMIFFIKVMEAFVAQHTALYKLEQEQNLQKKVDEVLREREIEKLASEVQQAKYE